MKPRGTVTSKLVDVLQILQLSRKTGLLAVERAASGDAIEQGTITFHNGQITDASIGPHRGAVALDILSKWSTCYFTLHTSTGTGNPSVVGTTPQPSPSQTGWSAPPVTAPHPVPFRAPYRTQSVDEALRYFPAWGLTRAHRQLFLLIDGRRSVPELIRLTGRVPNEVDGLLADLERAGFIRK